MAELLRQGQASERDVDTATARVTMDDLNGTVSGKLQVLFPAAGGWNFFWTPKEGDHVVVSKLPNGTQEGYVIGKVYTGNKMPQGGEPNIILIVSDDGKNVVKFDADNGTLDLIVDQTASIKCNALNIEVKKDLTIKSETADITVEKKATIKAESADIETKKETNIKCESAIIDASKSAEIKSPDIKMDSAKAKITGGNLEVGGTAAPTGTGPFCGLPACLITGAPHVGDKVAGT